MEVNGSGLGLSQDMEVDSSTVQAGGKAVAAADASGTGKPETSASDPVDASSSDSDDEATGEVGAGKTSSKSPEDKLVKTVSYKDRGNACIAAGDSAAALKHYERGIKIASSLPNDVQTRAILISLRLNLALACTKEERYFDAASAASKVLEVESANVKALFRRGVARARLGALEDANSDLLAVIKADPRNGGAKKELKAVRERLVEHRQREKASYGGLFDKGPMYNDKEVERQKREAEAAKRLKEEEKDWAKANAQRKIDGKEEQTLEDWRKEKKEAEEKAKKEREKKDKPKPRPPKPTSPAAPPKESSKKDDNETDEMELDEEDLKIIQDTKKQGYCYFKRTLSEKDQSLLDAEQMKLRAEKGVDAGVPSEGGRSVWNDAGTWEEVEKTEWCKGKLTEALSKVTVAVEDGGERGSLLERLGDCDLDAFRGGEGGRKSQEALTDLLKKPRASVTNVEIVGGDAHVICVSNKIKHLFEFNVKIKFTLSIEMVGVNPQSEGNGAQKSAADSGEAYKGTLEFPDMTNSDVDNGRFDSEPELKWDKAARWESIHNDKVKTCITKLKAGLLSAVETFFIEFKSS